MNQERISSIVAEIEAKVARDPRSHDSRTHGSLYFMAACNVASAAASGGQEHENIAVALLLWQRALLAWQNLPAADREQAATYVQVLYQFAFASEHLGRSSDAASALREAVMLQTRRRSQDPAASAPSPLAAALQTFASPSIEPAALRLFDRLRDGEPEERRDRFWEDILFLYQPAQRPQRFEAEVLVKVAASALAAARADDAFEAMNRAFWLTEITAPHQYQTLFARCLDMLQHAAVSPHIVDDRLVYIVWNN